MHCIVELWGNDIILRAINHILGERFYSWSIYYHHYNTLYVVLLLRKELSIRIALSLLVLLRLISSIRSRSANIH